jgi:hypothetical protein
MKIKLLVLLLIISSFFTLHSALGQGSLTPPGAPAPTMLTLSQVQPRIPITSVPFTITNSGSYYLTGNLGNGIVYVKVGPIYVPENTLAGTNGITILANNVTVDLSGYALTGIPGSSSATNGIYIGTVTNVTICHGSIAEFGNGIYAPANVVNARVTGLNLSDCVYSGIFINADSSLVESCMVNNAGNYGILAAQVRDSTAQNCVDNAINAFNVADNCYGSSSSGSGIATDNSAVNCIGNSSSGDGLYCAGTAINCSGSSSSNWGLYAAIANNCYGSSSGASEYGLYVEETATSCFGQNLTSSGRGIYAYIAIGCYGYGATIGIEADIANSCYSSSGDSEITYKYNMP